MIYLIVGDSGSGKTTIANLLNEKENFHKLITYTTRPIRPGEINGLDYFFCSKEDFILKNEKGFFLGVTYYSNNYYGIPKNELEKYVSSHKNILIIVDLNGVVEIKKKFKNSICIYLKTSDKDKAKRMKLRGESDKEIEERLKVSQDFDKFSDYIIDSSESIDKVLDKILKIVSLNKK